MARADARFYFDPVCPFAWMTSKWVRMVAARRGYTVEWRFISLRIINAGIDYDSHFPAGYEEGHASGLRLLRVAARARAALPPVPRRGEARRDPVTPPRPARRLAPPRRAPGALSSPARRAVRPSG